MATDLDRRYAVDDPRGTDVAVVRAQAVAALDFAEETVREAQASRRHAWWATLLLIVVCGAQAAAIAIMLPLKQVVPYTVLVDRQTGYMETVRGVQTGALKDDVAVVSSFLAQYVLQRETFDPADFADRYGRVALWSDGQARADYIASYRAGPDSVLNGMRPGATITVRVKNIEVLSPNTARVRFDLTHRDPGVAPATTDWQTFVTFRFTGAPMRMEDRLINPLGFQVTGYRRDQEYGAPRFAEAAPAPPTQPVVAPAAAQYAPPSGPEFAPPRAPKAPGPPSRSPQAPTQ